MDALALPATASSVARLRAGEHIAIIGASGSIGTAAVQLARHFGADATRPTTSATSSAARRARAPATTSTAPSSKPPRPASSRPPATASEVAYALGFEHPQHFSKLFKQKTGHSPSEWRKGVRAGNAS